MPSTPQRTALACMLAGAAIIGTNALMVRLAGTPPTVSAFWRMAFSAVLLLGYVLAARDWRPLPARTWAWIAVPAIAFSVDLWLWHRSILLVGPGLATLLGNAQVFFMALAGVLLFGERLGPRFLGGLLLAFFGLWLLLGGDWATLPPAYRWGVWLGLGTGACYAAFNLSLRRAQAEANRDDALRERARSAPVAQVLGLAALGSALCLGAAGLAGGDDFAIPGWSSFAYLLVLAAVGHCLSWVLISRAMPHLRVAVIGMLLLLQPVVAFLLDVWLFERATSPREWLGLMFTLAGIFVASMRRRARLPAAPADAT